MQFETKDISCKWQITVRGVSFFGTNHRLQVRHSKSNQPMTIHLPQIHLTRAGKKLTVSVSRDDIVLLDNSLYKTGGDGITLS
jgi:hypothetical protein